VNVWGVSAQGKSDEQLAREGLDAMESWMKEMGLVMNISELGANADMIEGIADATLILSGGYKQLDRSEVVDILKASL
jgi:alcohol dehydrogenase YqhD (iron-dependent ADH family)